jgi:hypothetical protein
MGPSITHDKAYEDKLEGRIGEAFFQRERLEWNTEWAEALEEMERLYRADRGDVEQILQLPELVNEAYALYSWLAPHEQRVLAGRQNKQCFWPVRPVRSRAGGVFRVGKCPPALQGPCSRFSSRSNTVRIPASKQSYRRP